MNPRGSHSGGAPRKYGSSVRTKMRELFKAGLKPYSIAKIVGCHRMTVYREFGMQK